jgi:hypothetical protein
MTRKAEDMDIERLEGRLENALQPVAPSAAYRHYLRDRLVDPPSELRLQAPERTPEYIILAAIGLTGSIILLIAAIRSLVLYARSRQKQLYPRSYY